MKREQTVTYKPSLTTEKPMIRISNLFLSKYGFQIGNKIEVEYADGFITIKLKNQRSDDSNGIKN